MASIEVEVASRRYTVACRDGEEAHLRALAALVDKRAQDAATALGSLSESRQLLFASLLLADDLNDREGGAPAAAAVQNGAVADALERLAARVESLAERLETGPGNP
jgi:cell division protein ZapA